ncbi:MAG: hypothetical protein MHPDNHAH_00704 [Anaerolineales bacterium]|nr:hypothetical protein [Anaerolineales bacterium]
MQAQPYIPGTKPADAGPLSRFIPPLEEGCVARWLSVHARTSSWLLDPFGFAPRLVLEAARSGYRVLVTVNNPITRFLLEVAANPPAESDFKAALAELETAKKGEERLGAHLQSLYKTTCEKCNQEIQVDHFLWRKGEDAPYARVYACPHCNDSDERVVTEQDIDRAKQIAATDGLHRSRAFERVAKLDDDDRFYAEEAIQHYLPRPLYFLTTVINRMDGLNLTPERKRALSALILVACDTGNTLWDHPSTRPRPKQLNIPNQFREHNLWTQLERGLSLWTETGSPVEIEAWPQRIPESGGVCIYEGRLKELAHEVKKEIPIAAAVGSLPRPNQAFWTLSALWAGWLWGREAVEPYKVALRRRRYDWAWNATALHAAFSHLFELLPLGTPFFGLMPEPEPQFLTSALTAASAAGFDLKSLALRTEHDPIQILWNRGEHLKREANEQDISVVREAIHAHLAERGEPASYLHVHAAGTIALAEAHALKNKNQEFDEAMRGTNALIQSALEEDERFVRYPSGLWSADLSPHGDDLSHHYDSLADRVEVAIVTFLQKNPNSIYLEIEDDLYPQFPGLLTPSKAMIYAVLDSYAAREGASLKLRAEDVASARRSERETIIPMLELVGKRLGYATSLVEKNHVWEENNSIQFAFYVLASALVGRAIAETPYAPEQTILVIPGGRASLIAYKASRDPALAERLKSYRLLKYRLLRAMLEVPVLTRETFEEQIASDPLEKSKSQMMMF